MHLVTPKRLLNVTARTSRDSSTARGQKTLFIPLNFLFVHFLLFPWSHTHIHTHSIYFSTVKALFLFLLYIVVHLFLHSLHFFLARACFNRAVCNEFLPLSRAMQFEWCVCVWTILISWIARRYQFPALWLYILAPANFILLLQHPESSLNTKSVVYISKLYVIIIPGYIRYNKRISYNFYSTHPCGTFSLDCFIILFVTF